MKQRHVIYFDSESIKATFNFLTPVPILWALQAFLVRTKELYNELAHKTKCAQCL